MNLYRADLHIHTVLSPCGDVDMSPIKIIKEAKKKGLDVIGITDHNSTLHTELIERLGKEEGVYVLKGAEITTKEEIHCLAFFDKDEEIKQFQEFLEDKLNFIQNNPEDFGYQVVVDDNEMILDQIEPLLIASIDVSIDELEKYVHKLNGIFIPAHVNKSKFSIESQLGFIPDNIQYDAIEISNTSSESDFRNKYSYLKDIAVIKNSDAHYIGDIGKCFNLLKMNELNFEEIKCALFNKNGRTIVN